jgi:drug/metabolite transporter (DMT)-like permease
MTSYMRNRRCTCLRCKTRNMMGGAILVTVGVLFLLSENGIVSFDDTWPVLLIVIGLLSFAAHSASTEGHIQPSWIGGHVPNQTQNDPGQTGTGPGPYNEAGR